MKTNTIKRMSALARASIEDPGELRAVLARLEGQTEPARRDKLLTTRQTAALAGVHPKTVLAWDRKGFIKARRITRRRIRFSRNEVERFLGESMEA